MLEFIVRCFVKLFTLMIRLIDNRIQGRASSGCITPVFIFIWIALASLWQLKNKSTRVNHKLPYSVYDSDMGNTPRHQNTQIRHRKS